MKKIYLVFFIICLHDIKCNSVGKLNDNLSDEIHSLVSEHIINQANIPISFHIQNPVTSFVGRITQLSEMKWAHVDKKMVILSGPKGIGKSELARKYAQEFKHDNTSSTIWIDSESHETLISSFKDLAVTIGIRIEGKSITSVIREIMTYFGNRKTLFVFDNSAEDNVIVNNLSNFLEKSNFTYVIVTSRNENWNLKKFKMIKVDYFMKEEAVEYLKRELKRSINLTVDDDSCDKLAKILAYLPLALSEAVLYIVQQNILYPKRVYSIDDYISHFQNKGLPVETVTVTEVRLTDDDIENILGRKVEAETKRFGKQLTKEAAKYGVIVAREFKRIENQFKTFLRKI